MEFAKGAVAQLGEHLLCKQGVTGSIPVSSTNLEGSIAMYLEREASLERKWVLLETQNFTVGFHRPSFEF